MARIHVLEREGNEVRVVVHVPTPAGNNSAGISRVNCAFASGLYGKTILADGDGTGGTIDPSEKGQIQACTIFEVEATARPHTAQETLNQYFDGFFTPIRIQAQDALKDQLQHFGFIRGTNP